MTHPVDLAETDFETAYRIAKARGMAERARVFRSILGATSRAVRGLFSQPEQRCAEC